MVEKLGMFEIDKILKMIFLFTGGLKMGNLWDPGSENRADLKNTENHEDRVWKFCKDPENSDTMNYS